MQAALTATNDHVLGARWGPGDSTYTTPVGKLQLRALRDWCATVVTACAPRKFLLVSTRARVPC